GSAVAPAVGPASYGQITPYVSVSPGTAKIALSGLRSSDGSPNQVTQDLVDGGHYTAVALAKGSKGFELKLYRDGHARKGTARLRARDRARRPRRRRRTAVGADRARRRARGGDRRRVAAVARASQRPAVNAHVAGRAALGVMIPALVAGLLAFLLIPRPDGSAPIQISVGESKPPAELARMAATAPLRPIVVRGGRTRLGHGAAGPATTGDRPAEPAHLAIPALGVRADVQHV